MVLKLESLFDLMNSNPSEQGCINYFEERRWKGKVISSFDPSSKSINVLVINKETILGEDIMDVWLDSGVSHWCVLRREMRD